MRRQLTFSLVWILVSTSTGFAAPPARHAAHLARVVDGDTLRVRLDSGEEETVRLIGIDTPETVHPRIGVQPWGAEASAYTRALLPPGEPVALELDVEERDRYGRLLAYVYLRDGREVNALLLNEGLAQLLTIPPNVKHVDRYVRLQEEARHARRGMWGDQPWESSEMPVHLVVDRKAERATVTNAAAGRLDLSGWKLHSVTGDQSYTFPLGTVLEPGDSITVISGQYATSGSGLLPWTRANVWNNDGDPAELYDAAGKRVAGAD